MPRRHRRDAGRRDRRGRQRASRATCGATPPAATWAAGRSRVACDAAARAHRQRRHAGRTSTRTPGTSSSPSRPRTCRRRSALERADLAPGVPAGPLRDELPAAAPAARPGQARIDVYFTRVYNPVWTNPDGCSWIEMLEDEEKIGCHVALTPTWSRPRSGPTTCCRWGSARAPRPDEPGDSRRHLDRLPPAGAARVPRGSRGRPADSTRRDQPGRGLGRDGVLDRADLPHRSRRLPGNPQVLRVPERIPGTPIGIDEYFGEIFDQPVPGLPEAAAKEGLTPLDYMRRYGAFDVPYAGSTKALRQAGHRSAGDDDEKRRGFPTPSRQARDLLPHAGRVGLRRSRRAPDYIRSPTSTGAQHRTPAAGEMVLLPTFRLPTLIHTRSGNAKWLQEISHTNPLWIHPEDAERIGCRDGDLARVATRIGTSSPRLGHRGHPPGRSWPAPTTSGAGDCTARRGRPPVLGSRRHRSGAGRFASARSSGVGRSRATTPTPIACGGARSASTRT